MSNIEANTAFVCGIVASSVSSISERKRLKKYNDYVSVFSSRESERSYFDLLGDPEWYERLYSGIEDYKRRHPEIIIKEGASSYWKTVGKIRFKTFWNEGDSKKLIPEIVENRNRVVEMLCDIDGKKTYSRASQEAKEKYFK